LPPTDHFIEPDWPAPANIRALSTTRQGGCSAAPFDSLNLGHHVEDDPAAVAANRGVLSGNLPAGTDIQWLTQVHGVQVVEAGINNDYPAADAVWSKAPGKACAVLTADCLPVLFCTVSGDRVAAAHGGWRGLVDGVLEATVAALDADPQQLMAWLGPAIGPLAFEVGPEVRNRFMAAAPSHAQVPVGACFQPSDASPGHYFADLYALARHRLGSLGITAVFGGDCCTYTDARRFYSYRRDGQTGRMATLILRQ
jgi:YfiH family protein